MSFWSRLLGRQSTKSTSLELFRELFGGRESKSGAVVNWKTSLEVTTVLACCKVIAEGVAQVPWRVYQDTGNGRSVAREHPLHMLIYRRPNAWQTSFEFRETLLFHLVLAGNAYVFVNRVGSDRRVIELVPIEPGMVTVRRGDDMALTYRVRREDGQSKDFPADAIWHIRGPSWNSWMGLDAVGLAREAIGLALSTEATHARFHKNGAKTSGLYSLEGTVTPEQYKVLSAWLDEAINGDNAWKPLVLDRSAKFSPNQMSGVDSQHLETRKFQIEEICRAARVMPIMVGYSDKAATYASAEQMFLAHVVHTLSPWYERLEQSADANLLTDADREAGFYTKFTPQALMRGAQKDRAEFYTKALGSGGGKGWMTQNEVRALEELDRSDDPAADELAQPVNAGPATEAGPDDDPPPQE